MYQRSSTPTQARCHSEADLREAAKLSTSRRQNSDHGGPCSIRSRRRSASRRHLSRPSVSCFTDAEKNASLACASSLIERDCSTSMRKRFISMSSSFSSRRMTGNGSGASQGWGPRNGVMMTTFAAALIWRAIACRSVVYSWLRYGRTLEISKLCAQRSDGRRWHASRARKLTKVSAAPIVQERRLGVRKSLINGRSRSRPFEPFSGAVLTTTRLVEAPTLIADWEADAPVR